MHIEYKYLKFTNSVFDFVKKGESIKQKFLTETSQQYETYI